MDLISTGLGKLDDLLGGGYRRGTLNSWSAPRQHGKTTLSLNTALNQSQAGQHVVYASLELPSEALMERLLSRISGVPFADLRRKCKLTEEQKAKVGQVALQSKGTLTFNDHHAEACTPEQLDAGLGDSKPDVIYVDYLTMFDFRPFGYDLTQGGLECARQLKLLAERRNCAVVLLANSNGKGEVKYGCGPEEVTDTWLHWECGEEQKDNGGLTALVLDKSRYSGTGMVRVQFDFSPMMVTEVQEER